MASDSADGADAKKETVYTKESPFRASFESMTPLITTENGTTYNIVLNTEGFSFVEGQVITVYVNHDKPDEKPNMMYLSVASSRYGDAQDGKSLSLCVLVKAGRDNYFGSLAKGDPVMLTGPFGKTMLLPEGPLSFSLVGISVGTGIAPYRAFSKLLFVDSKVKPEFSDAPFSGKMTVITTGASRADLVYTDEFEAIEKEAGGNFKYDATATGESILERIKANVGDGKPITDSLKNGGHVYIAGPLKSIMDDVLAALKDSSPDAEDMIAAAKTEGRWHVEVY